ncbi:hypothetical protein RHMOL_Rhmol12G0178200 [Rhododendron molle]|uniref:Uncharacterized protein n=1 Tax=Rhododendron molle TaxID=49168 RepID=A0ACC0LKZ2_RHOML|nr:hypothetical protein RHMOL_Rhmol12G0178200 [Rhododendron molle]
MDEASFIPFRSLYSSSDPTFGGDSQTKDDVKEDRKAKDLRTHEVLSKLISGVLFIKTSLTWKDMVIDSGSGIGTAFLLEKNKAATTAHVVSEQYMFEIDGKRRKEFLTFRVWAKLPRGFSLKFKYRPLTRFMMSPFSHCPRGWIVGASQQTPQNKSQALWKIGTSIGGNWNYRASF